jgi:lysophospholipase
MPLDFQSALITPTSSQLTEFWATGQFAHFIGKDDIDIHYAQFIKQENQASVVISPGRVEGYLKYQEVAYQFMAAGFNVHIIDHRGQGLSGRMLRNPHKGFVQYFDDYSDDFCYFIENVVKANDNNPLVILAHSMGAAIAIRTLQRFQLPIQAQVLCSPMIGINTGGIPKTMALMIASLLNGMNRTFSTQSWYFWGQGNYHPEPFETNRLTHDALRYQRFIELYQQVPQLQLGGVTVQWLLQALLVQDDIFNDIDRLNVPTCVLQAGADTIVDNQAQQRFCQLLHQHSPLLCEKNPIVIDGARHELLIESDEFRTPALTLAFQFFAQQLKNRD